MKKLQIFFYTASCVVLLTTGAFAQFRDAGAKIRGEQFVPGDLNETYMRQRHAQEHAQMLYYYGQMQQPVPKEKLQEQAAGLRENTSAARKAIAKVKAADPSDAELQKRVDAIDASLAKCEAECDMLGKQLGEDKADAAKICACCALAHKHLDKAQGETARLMKDLSIKRVEAPQQEHGASVTRMTFLLFGLHCPPCTTTVEQGLRSVKGVRAAKADWGTKTAVVEVDETVNPAQSVAMRIGATPHMMGGQMRYQAWLTVKVSGLDKPESAERAKNILAKLSGVDRVVAYPAQQMLAVSFRNKGTVTAQAVLDELADFKPSLYQVPSASKSTSQQRSNPAHSTHANNVSHSTKTMSVVPQRSGNCPHCR